MAGERTELHHGKGYGFISHKEPERVYMVRCFQCGRENYAMAVRSGQCAWCGHQATPRDVLEEKP